MDETHPTRPGRAEHPVVLCFQELHDRLAGTAFHVLGHPEDAREAVQEAFLKCWRRRRQAEGAVNLKAWVFSVLMNTARDMRRRRRVRRAESLPTEATMASPGTATNPAHVAQHREALVRVRAAIRTLPETEREVFLLRQNGDLTYEDVAGMLGIPVGTAKTRMRSALHRLREAVEGGSRATRPERRPA